MQEDEEFKIILHYKANQKPVQAARDLVIATPLNNEETNVKQQ